MATILIDAEVFNNMEKELVFSQRLLNQARLDYEELELQKELEQSSADRLIEELKSELFELQSLDFWGRLVRLFKGY